MFLLKLDTENAAFDEREEEIARILGDVAAKLRDGASHGVIHDLNGNRVGSFDADAMGRAR